MQEVWQHYAHSKMKITEINVEDIDVVQNSRVRTDESDVSALMQDIKQHGLMHPIGVFKNGKGYTLLFGSRRLKSFKKLGYEKIPAQVYDVMPTEQELLLINSSENIHRENLTPYEVGRVISMLHGQGLNINEVATRLEISPSKAKILYDIYKRVPEDIQKSIENVKTSRNPEGKLSMTTVKTALNIRLKSSDIAKLLRYAKQNNLNRTDVRNIGMLIREGKTLEQALKSMKDLIIKTTGVPLNKTKANEYFKKNNTSFSAYVADVLKGNIKPNPDILA